MPWSVYGAKVRVNFWVFFSGFDSGGGGCEGWFCILWSYCIVYRKVSEWRWISWDERKCGGRVTRKMWSVWDVVLGSLALLKNNRCLHSSGFFLSGVRRERKWEDEWKCFSGFASGLIIWSLGFRRALLCKNKCVHVCFVCIHDFGVYKECTRVYRPFLVWYRTHRHFSFSPKWDSSGPVREGCRDKRLHVQINEECPPAIPSQT